MARIHLAGNIAEAGAHSAADRTDGMFWCAAVKCSKIAGFLPLYLPFFRKMAGFVPPNSAAPPPATDLIEPPHAGRRCFFASALAVSARRRCSSQCRLAARRSRDSSGRFGRGRAGMPGLRWQVAAAPQIGARSKAATARVKRELTGTGRALGR
jgi:hypothetical protein